jgi:hypothetical protein
VTIPRQNPVAADPTSLGTLLAAGPSVLGALLKFFPLSNKKPRQLHIEGKHSRHDVESPPLPYTRGELTPDAIRPSYILWKSKNNAYNACFGNSSLEDAVNAEFMCTYSLKFDKQLALA